MRISLLVLFVFVGFLLHAQLSPNQTVTLKAGTYTPDSIVELLYDQGISLSFVSHALTKKPVQLKQANPSLQYILSKLFNEAKYRFVYKAQSVVITARKEQEVLNLSGYLEESISGERLVGAHLYVPQKQLGTTCNPFGFFSISLATTDTVEVHITAMGYVSKKVQLVPGDDPRIISLDKATEELETVELINKPLFTEITQMSEAQFQAEFTKRTPSFLGEPDILKTVQALPGVQGGMEGASGLFIRGGSVDQNLLLLDGVPVYNASHLFGLFSVFNADAIKNVSLIKGGFPARYGGRLSSVLSIDMKEGNLQEYHGNAAVGLIASRFSLEGPILKNKMSFMVSGRRTYWDILARSITDISTFSYYFNDVNAKVNYIISPKDRLYASFYSGGDVLKLSAELVGGDDDAVRINWGNKTGALRWNHLHNDNLFSNLTATYSRYSFNTAVHYLQDRQEVNIDYRSSIQDLGLKYDFEYQRYVAHKIRFGLSYLFHQTRPNSLLASEVPEISNLGGVNGNDWFLYVEDDWALTPTLKLNAGLHYSAYLVEKRMYHYPQPRLSARYLLGEQWSVKASYANMAQFIHLLTSEGAGLPTDLWVSSTAQIKPQTSNQLAFGSFHQFGEGDWEVSAEVYHKWMDQLIAYKDGASFLTSADWQNAVETDGKGWAYGLELFLKRLEGNTTGWIAYTWSKSERQFSNLNNGERYPFKYDRRHNINVVLNHKFSERFDMGLNWKFATGQAFTLPTSTYYLLDPVTNQPVLYTDYSERNSYRYPAYHRLDLSMNFRKKLDWAERTWNISIYNVYNRQNAFYIDVTFLDGKAVAEQTSLFPFLPSISYVLDF
jgi:outer membrane receptor for ferrienterochelin and colicin